MGRYHKLLDTYGNSGSGSLTAVRNGVATHTQPRRLHGNQGDSPRTRIRGTYRMNANDPTTQPPNVTSNYYPSRHEAGKWSSKPAVLQANEKGTGRGEDRLDCTHELQYYYAVLLLKPSGRTAVRRPPRAQDLHWGLFTMTPTGPDLPKFQGPQCGGRYSDICLCSRRRGKESARARHKGLALPRAAASPV